METRLNKMYKLTMKDHSSINPYEEKKSINPKNCELLNIIHTELTKPSYHPSISTKHISIQCSSNDFNTQINQSDSILIGHSSSSCSTTTKTKSIPSRPGYNECGIQVDLNENNLDLLINIYSNHLSIEMIEQFYEICHFDYQWTCLQIDEYIQNKITSSIPTLQQLSLNKLQQWNEQIKTINPLFDTKSINDLLEDINEEEIFQDCILDNSPTIEITNTNHINIPWSIVNLLEENYGKLPIDSSLLSSSTNNNNGILLPFDNDLSKNIYQALQRFLIKSDQIDKPVIEKKKKPNKTNNQKWKLSTENQHSFQSNTNSIPSLKQIIHEEQQAAKSQKSKKKPQLDYVTEHKLKELQQHFPSFDTDLLYDIFRENEYDYDLTFICISTMFDENISISNIHRSSQPISLSSSSSQTKTKPIVEPVLESYEISRHDVARHAKQRKEFYTKAQQANRRGMSGVASFYIHRACEETQLMKDANRAACERLSRWRLEQFYQTQRLDLHGLHLDEALNLFKQIEQELNEGNKKTTPKSIEIITGYGKNSIYGGGHGKIRSCILTYLQQRNYKYSEPNKGVILLQLTNTRN